MATYNSSNGNYQTGNKTLFEAQMLAISNGHIVDVNNRLPVDIGNASISITGNVNVTSSSNNNIHNSNGDPITNSTPLPVFISNTVTVANSYQPTQNVSFSNQTVTILGGVATARGVRSGRTGDQRIKR